MRLLGKASYIDGGSGRQIPVTLAADGDSLILFRPDGAELDRWRGADLRPLPPADGAVPDDCPAAVFGIAVESPIRLVVGEPATRDALTATFPTAAGRAHRPRRDVPLAGWIGGAAVSLVIVLFVLIPALAEPLARLIPPSWETALGRRVVDIAAVQLAEPGERLRCDSPAGLAALDRLTDRLHDPDHPPLRVRVIGSKMVNAFAAPGGHIVIPVGMIRFAEGPEALAGVLAHEMGHVVRGHSTVRIMRVIMLSTVVGLATGDLGGGFLALAVTQAMESGYSRDQEREADAFAADLLHRSGIGLGGTIALFERLSAEKEGMPGWAAWISTHPDTAERIAALRAAADAPTRSPPMSAAEWTALLEICGPAPSGTPSADTPVSGASD